MLDIWGFLVYGLWIPGLVLNSLLMSGFGWTSRIGGKIGRCKLSLSTAKWGEISASLVVVCTAFCLLVFVAQHLALRRVQHMATTSISAVELQDQFLKNKFRCERNWWMSVSCLLTWAAAWRLTVMQEAGLLQPWWPRMSWKLKSRAAWLGLAFVIFLIGDLPLSRVNYWFQIASNITPNKMELLDQHGDQCKDVRLDSCRNGKTDLCSDGCNAFCENVRVLAEDRQNVVHWVRNSHLTGKWGAELFDKGRGVQQTGERIEDLFASKTCLKVLESIDKSNFMVNVVCMACAVVIFFLFLWILAHVLEGLGGPEVPIPTPSAPSAEVASVPSAEVASVPLNKEEKKNQ